MQNELLTFNDLPMVVGRLADEIAALRQKIDLLQENTRPVGQNTHIPMSVEEAAVYLRIPLNTLYAKLSAGTIPATKPGKRYCLYQDELDKWLESNRKNPVPLTDEENNAAILGSHRRKPGKSSWL